MHEDHQLRLDASRARIELGWKPRLKIETALEWTLTGTGVRMQGADMKRETLAQIATF